MSYETRLAAALLAPEPGACAGELGVDPDGLRLAALLVARLRFERLLRGSPRAEHWFDTDPEDFARAFRRYHAEVPPRAFFPTAEAADFDGWAGRSSSPGV